MRGRGKLTKGPKLRYVIYEWSLMIAGTVVVVQLVQWYSWYNGSGTFATLDSWYSGSGTACTVVEVQLVQWSLLL